MSAHSRCGGSPARSLVTRRQVVRGLGLAGLAGGAGWVVGACAASRAGAGDYAVARPAATLRCVSWNIRHGQGMDGAVDLERIGVTLARLAPDLVLLQEVDRGCMRSGGVDQARALGEQLGCASVFAAHRAFDGGEYGLAALSRTGFIGQRALVLDAAPRPLVALAVTIAVEGSASLTAVGVHLVDTVEQRTAEVRAITAYLDAVSGPVLVCGDFNSVRDSPPLGAFEGYDCALPEPPRETFPADAPVREIDFVLTRASGGAGVVRAWVDSEALASDHRPVVADIALRSL